MVEFVIASRCEAATWQSKVGGLPTFARNDGENTAQ
jgi:hypothetical protein